MGPEPGTKLITNEAVSHGDWKTASIHPDHWPTLRAGTVVEFIKEWTNFYGRWWKVKGPNGSRYDVEPWKLTPQDSGRKRDE